MSTGWLSDFLNLKLSRRSSKYTLRTRSQSLSDASNLCPRGLTVWSGLPSLQTRLIWQLCWALGAHGQARALPCQVTMHWVHPGADASAAHSSDEPPHSPSTETAASMASSAPPYAAAGTGDAASDASRSQRSLLILVSACHMVLAVMLTAYDEDIEELAGTDDGNVVMCACPIYFAHNDTLYQYNVASYYSLTGAKRVHETVPANQRGIV